MATITLAQRIGRSSKTGLLTLLRALPGLGRQRRHLARLDDRLLRDIGVSRTEAAQEASRAVWDVPAHWRQ